MERNNINNQKNYHISNLKVSRFRPTVEDVAKTPKQRFKRAVKVLILQLRWTKFCQKVADEEQMVKVHRMDDLKNPDILPFNPGGKLDTVSSSSSNGSSSSGTAFP